MSWPKVRLGEILKEEKTRIGSSDADGLPLLGVSNANGIHQSLKPRIDDMSRYLRVNHHWFAYNPMRINVGSIGWAEHESQTGVISPDYVVFSCNNHVDPRFVYLYLRSAVGLQAINLETAGSVRERLYFDALAQIKMPLPPIVEQHRVVAQINVLAEQIQEAQSLRESVRKDLDMLLVCMAHRPDLDDRTKGVMQWQRKPLGACLTLAMESHRVDVNASYRNLGIFSFGKGLFHKPPIEGISTSAASLGRVRAGQFIYSRLFAFEGSYGIVTQEFDDHFVSNEYPTFDCNPELVRAEFLEAYFKAPFVWKAVAVGSKGLGDRRQRVHPSQVLNHNIWLPPMEWQNRIAEVREQINAVNALRSDTSAEFGALLPSVLDRAFSGRL